MGLFTRAKHLRQWFDDPKILQSEEVTRALAEIGETLVIIYGSLQESIGKEEMEKYLSNFCNNIRRAINETDDRTTSDHRLH